MKKVILFLLCCAMLTASVSCNKNDDINSEHADKSEDILSVDNDDLFSPNSSKKPSVSEETLPENIELIQSEKHFQIYKYKDAVNKHFYRILDYNGNTVISETTTRPLSVSIIEDDIIDISISFGSGVCQHQYYAIDKNILSELFVDVFATSGELIVHMNVPKENAMENRILVIQNIFDKEVLFVEYKLDFSNYVIPIEKIEFLTASNSLQITYYKGSEKELTTEILNYS